MGKGVKKVVIVTFTVNGKLFCCIESTACSWLQRHEWMSINCFPRSIGLPRL